MRRTQGYIPRNLGSGTFWDGRLKIRNTVEALIVCVIVYFLTKVLEVFVSFLVAVSLRLVLWVLLGGLTLNGAYGEPLSIYLLNIINYGNTRNYVTLKPPQRDMPANEKEPQEKKKTISDWIFIKGPKERHAKNKDS